MTNISSPDILNISENDILCSDVLRYDMLISAQLSIWHQTMEVWEVVVLAEKQMVMTEAFYYILLSLMAPNHGYGIIQNTMELTDGRLELGAGTLYGAINTLLDRGWIRLYSEDKQSRKKKQYMITEQGMLALEQEIGRLEELLQNGRRVLHEGGAKPEETNAETGKRKEKEAAANEEVQVVF